MSNAAVADKVWTRLGHMFGTRWYETYGAKVNDEWKSAIGSLRTDQVNGAIANIRNSSRAHPPTLPEFIALAKGVRLEQANQQDATGADLSRYHQYGNRALLAWLCKYGPVGEPTMRHLVAEKNRLCDAYRVICEDEPEACEELKGKLMTAFESVLIARKAA